MNTVRIIGLGTSDTDKMPLGVYKELKNAKKVFVRTMDHPAVEMLQDEGVEITNFDSYYEREDTFQDTYEEITAARQTMYSMLSRGIRGSMRRRQSVFLKRLTEAE